MHLVRVSQTKINVTKTTTQNKESIDDLLITYSLQTFYCFAFTRLARMARKKFRTVIRIVKGGLVTSTGSTNHIRGFKVPLRWDASYKDCYAVFTQFLRSFFDNYAV